MFAGIQYNLLHGSWAVVQGLKLKIKTTRIYHAHACHVCKTDWQLLMSGPVPLKQSFPVPTEATAFLHACQSAQGGFCLANHTLSDPD